MNTFSICIHCFVNLHTKHTYAHTPHNCLIRSTEQITAIHIFEFHRSTGGHQTFADFHRTRISSAVKRCHFLENRLAGEIKSTMMDSQRDLGHSDLLLFSTTIAPNISDRSQLPNAAVFVLSPGVLY
eukprot:c9158_g1_i6.p1 GENE.c9158_g1_i6~~c9158_g1_i6.p1  ORF type:complete len:127 (-),score=14.85 c9158_g1_i6:121-501(-)